MGRIVVKVGRPAACGAEAAQDASTRFAQAEPRPAGREGGLGAIGDALEFDALRRFYFQPALLVADLETLEAQCVVVPPGDVVAIGRGPDCEVSINSDRVSRRHAEVRHRGRSALAIRDLGSTNGTSVNGAPLAAGKDAPLRPGDVVLLGSSFLLRAFPLGSSPAHAAESFLFPLWVFLGQAAVESSSFLRCCHIVSAFEHLARVIACADLAHSPPTPSAQALLGKSKLSMGEWVQAARGALMRSPSDGAGASASPVGAMLRGADGAPESPKPLLENLNFAVEWRNANVGHGAPQADHAYRRPHADLSARVRETLETFPAFRDALVVSASDCRVAAAGEYRTQVVVHDPVWGFRRPIVARRTAPILPGAYLAVPGIDDLIGLGGRVRVGTCPECGAEELFVADGLAPTAPFTSPTTNHKAEARDLAAQNAGA
ncbi:MAG: FHA domain-containing protein [Myxococcota bacterium]|nr:FHA domain-containing protein [Myxococcota bacterium]